MPTRNLSHAAQQLYLQLAGKFVTMTEISDVLPERDVALKVWQELVRAELASGELDAGEICHIRAPAEM